MMRFLCSAIVLLLSLQGASAQPGKTLLAGELSEPNYSFEFVKSGSRYKLCLYKKPRPNREVAHCLDLRMKQKEMFGYNDEIYCKYQDQPAFVFYKKAKYQHEQKIKPNRAWVFNLKTERIDTVPASKVECHYNKTTQ